MNRKRQFTAVWLGLALVLAACVQSSETATASSDTTTVTAATASTSCETTFTQSSLNMQKLCVPGAGTGRHFRLEGARLQAANTALYLYLGGYTSGLESGTSAPATDSGKLRVLLYQGNANPTLQYGNTTSVNTTTAYNGYNSAQTTMCLDVSGDAPARVTVWASGTNGADCTDKATLTIATAILDKSDWTVTDALSSGTNYVRTSDTSNALLTKVTVSSELALAASTCESAPSSGFSSICKPSAGQAKHYRLEGVQTSIAHSAAAIFLGVSAQPGSSSDVTTAGQAKLLFYHGNGAAPPPTANVDYSGQSTTPSYTAYSASSQTICFDVTTASPPRITVWATGTNSANCSDKTTLTAANSISNKSDWSTAQALANNLVYYYRGTSVTTSKVTAFTTTFGTGF